MGKVMPNAQQRKVVEAIEGPILISAGPGTGKTATLVNRYANMVNNHHIKPKNIMMVTFTEKAAKEIITRISAMVPKRIKEIEEMTENVSAGKIYVTAFLDFKTFKKFSESLAWETEVWIADMPDHMIHLNGDKFLGPRK